MPSEVTNGQILEAIRENQIAIRENQEAIHELRGTVHELQGTVQENQHAIVGLREDMHEMRGTVQIFQGEMCELRGTMQGLQGDMKELRGTVQGLEGTVQGLQGTVQGLEGTVQGLQGDMKELVEDMHDTLEIVSFLKDNAASKEDLARVETRVTRIEATMVTKDYLDNKLGDAKGDIIVLMRKEDAKIGVLVDVLQERKVISSVDAKRVLSMKPFPSA